MGSCTLSPLPVSPLDAAADAADESTLKIMIYCIFYKQGQLWSGNTHI